jgi:hypothetical protein
MLDEDRNGAYIHSSGSRTDDMLLIPEASAPVYRNANAAPAEDAQQTQRRSSAMIVMNIWFTKKQRYHVRLLLSPASLDRPVPSAPALLTTRTNSERHSLSRIRAYPIIT